MTRFPSLRVTVLVCCAIVATFLLTRPAVAQGVLKPVMAFIVNDAAHPVPVAVQGDIALTGPLAVEGTVSVAGAVGVIPPPWQGTPFVESHVVLNNNADGFEQCEEVFTADSGTAVILKTLSVSFNVPPGGFGGSRARVTLPGGDQTYVPVPDARSAPASQVVGLYDAYSGSLDMGGVPVVALDYCLHGIDAAGTMAAIGFSVLAP
jgi:hypothetical protein